MTVAAPVMRKVLLQRVGQRKQRTEHGEEREDRAPERHAEGVGRRPETRAASVDRQARRGPRELAMLLASTRHDSRHCL